MDDKTIKERTKLFMDELQQIGGITLVSNKPYINQKGLQHLAKKQGVQSQKTTLVQWACNPEKGFWVVKAEIVDATGATHTGLGDASPNNVGTNIKSATLRMAETRAINRTLRRVLRGPGVADTSAEEIPGVGDSADPDLPAGPVDAEPPTGGFQKPTGGTLSPEDLVDPKWVDEAPQFMIEALQHVRVPEGENKFEWLNKCAADLGHDTRISHMTSHQRIKLMAAFRGEGAA